MSLFMLPSRSRHAGGGSRSDAGGPAPLQGCFELERLIGEVVKLGADHSRLKAKMFGGSRNLSGVTDAGARTTAFVRQFLRQQGLPLVEEKIGDRHPRRIVYFPYSGTALVKRLSSRHSATVANQETQYVDSLVLEPMTINLAPESPASARRS
jgi:chemotaxis protein CheD